ncbi:MAG: bifunctional adenosylcobinamide kinase/adenosylcobinamide-phosphate guanylyltransferase [Alphaproteobacteria bacterium]|nr:bifunctional adenosylcobinamide kinase/adenosylcobinamide-phosphate guanylyltransferase [Alphaproteobacteria bacterium]
MTPGASACTLVLGGARSGKSRFAEERMEKSGRSLLYVATGRPFDEEMKVRVDQHKARRGCKWQTIEEPVELTRTLSEEAAEDRAILIDCLTLWVTNLMLEDRDVRAESDTLAASIGSLPGLLVFVSNEVGLGIVPDNPMARAFRDHAGHLHQKIAEQADSVFFIAAGLPMTMKG